MLTLPTYRQWLAFRTALPLPHMLLCIACGVRIDWRAYDVARRGKHDAFDREQAAVVRVGAVCKERQYEWYIPADGTSEDIIESHRDIVVPFYASGMGCPDCQVRQAYVTAEAMRECHALNAEQRPVRTVVVVPFAFNPTTNLRLPTAISTRTTYIRRMTQRSPTMRVPFIDVGYDVLAVQIPHVKNP